VEIEGLNMNLGKKPWEKTWEITGMEVFKARNPMVLLG
jgi:hypothetical protein